MPTITPGNKVLVTGANGFVACWVIRTLLEQGYAVRGTVRSLGKGRHLCELFKDYEDQFELVVVEDITKVCYYYLLRSFLYELKKFCFFRKVLLTELLKASMRLHTPHRRFIHMLMIPRVGIVTFCLFYCSRTP